MVKDLDRLKALTSKFSFFETWHSLRKYPLPQIAESTCAAPYLCECALKKVLAKDGPTFAFESSWSIL